MATELVSEEGSSDPLKELLPSTQEPMAGGSFRRHRHLGRG